MTRGNTERLTVTLETQDFLVQPVDASWLQCNIECQEACPVGVTLSQTLATRPSGLTRKVTRWVLMKLFPIICFSPQTP